MDERQTLHTLVDELPAPELLPARRFLEYLREHGADPLRAVLDAAPLDDEPTTAGDLQAVNRGLEDYAKGATVSQQDVEGLMAGESASSR